MRVNSTAAALPPMERSGTNGATGSVVPSGLQAARRVWQWRERAGGRASGPPLLGREVRVRPMLRAGLRWGSDRSIPRRARVHQRAQRDHWSDQRGQRPAKRGFQAHELPETHLAHS